MKKILLVALISGITLNAFGQKRHGEMNHEQKLSEQSEKLVSELKLNEKQTKKLDKINADFLKEVESNSKLKEAMRSEADQMILAYNKDIKSILNEEQKSEYDLMILKGKERFNSERNARNSKHRGNSKKMSKEEMMKKRQNALAKKLELDEAQVEKFNEINQKYATQKVEMRKRHQAVVESTKDMMIKREIKIEKMLNDEQLVEFKKLKLDKRSKHMRQKSRKS